MPDDLQKAIKKRRAFESPEEKGILNLFRTSDRLQFLFARLFREHGLTTSQYNVLRILRGEGKPLPCLEIAERLVAAVPGVTGLIDRLERLGLAARDRSTDDRRVVYITISKAGLERLEKLDQPVADMHKVLMGHLTRAELKELSRLLEKARNAGGLA